MKIRGWWAYLPLMALALAPLEAQSSSSLLLPYPPNLGHIPAVTFDTDGQPVGQSDFSLIELDNGELRMNVDMRIAGGAANHSWAEFEVVPSGTDEEPRLRLLREGSQSYDAEGTPLTLLQIDHVAGIATCTPPEANAGHESSLALPVDDRVANVPMNLLFLPVVRGEVESVQFQLLTCRGGARLYPFVALADGPAFQSGDQRILEVRYRPDLGQMMSWASKLMVPRLSFWFDTSRNGAYVGHRMPLYSKGPEILMVRNGMLPPALGDPY